MQTYSLASNTARRANFDEPASRNFKDPHPRQGAKLRLIDRGFDNVGQRSAARARRQVDCDVDDASSRALDIVPAHLVSRRAFAWDGVKVEIVQSATHDNLEFRFLSPCHLLLVYEEGVRGEGETLVDDLPCSTLRTLARRLTFVPARHEFREWHRPQGRTRIICFYLDPDKMPIHPASSQAAGTFRPCVLFENGVLWETAVKLAKAIEGGSEDERYAEALVVVAAHELLRIHGNLRRHGPPVRGGLAAWQQRIISAYIEEHLAESMPLGALAELVRLSSFHFCRAFKQSFGVPPHRYLMNRRIEHAKTLLANPSQSVTDVAFELGFSEMSSFSAAFRKATGTTPSKYRRTL
jgi:AraC family transcriptional regulator